MAARKAREADPPTQLRQLMSALESAPLARGYVLRGEEPYFRDKAESALRAKAAAEGQEVCVHDTEDPDFVRTRLADDLSGGGLFAARRCVLLRNAQRLATKEDSGPDTGLGRALRGFVESPDDVGTLVLSGSSIRADNHVVKAVKAKGGTVLSSRKLWDSPPPWNPDPRQVEVVQWLGARARDLGLRLAPDQAAYVVAATGNDLYALEDQLERLRGSSPEQLQKLVGWNADGSPWKVADLLVSGEAPRALSGLEGLFRGGFKQKDGKRVVDSAGLATMLLSGLTGKVRQNLAGSRALAGGQTLAQAADAAGVPNNSRARGDFESTVRAQPPEVWARRLEELAGLERRVKGSGQVDGNDFALLAVRWGRRAGAGRGTPTGPRR